MSEDSNKNKGIKKSDSNIEGETSKEQMIQNDSNNTKLIQNKNKVFLKNKQDYHKELLLFYKLY